jgi:hypothetical protein
LIFGCSSIDACGFADRPGAASARSRVGAHRENESEISMKDAECQPAAIIPVFAGGQQGEAALVLFVVIYKGRRRSLSLWLWRGRREFREALPAGSAGPAFAFSL